MPEYQESLIDTIQHKYLFGGEAISADSAEYGVYTWILKKFDHDGATVLVATMPPGPQEFGSLHANLNAFTKPGTIVAAGEMEKKEEGIFYNFLSGTYMQPKYDKAVKEATKKGLDVKKSIDDLTADLIAKSTPYLPAGATYTTDALIEGRPIAVTANYRHLAKRTKYTPPQKGSARKTRRRRRHSRRRRL